MFFRNRGALEECRTLCQDRLECVDIILRHIIRSISNRREFDADESTRLRTEIPAGDQVAVRRLVVDLSRGRKGKVQFRGKMQVKIEIFLWWSICLRGRSTCWDH